MDTAPRACRRTATAAILLLLAATAWPASVIVPSLEMISHVANTGVTLEVQTYANMALSLEGGAKFGGTVAFGLLHQQSIELLEASGLSLDFLSASMSARDVLSLPVNISYFVGAGDVLCSGDGFTQFGVQPIMTAYRGYFAFATGPQYDGIYEVWGSGVHVQFVPKAETASLDLYVYEDTHPTWPGGSPPLISSLGAWSGDLRFLLNFPAVKVESFVGATLVPTGAPFGLYRGGLLFYATGGNVEFLAQVGIPLWDPSEYPALNVDLFYLLVEPRLHLGIVSVVPTFVWHPAGYMQGINPDEVGAFDVNLNISLGDVARSARQGGVEGNIRFQSSLGQFMVKASPWFGFMTPGVLWTLKLTANLFPFDARQLLEGFVGVRAQF